MTLSAVRSRAVLRACVVTAVREGETLMDQLVKFTLDELAKQESETRAIAKRDLAHEAQKLLREHHAGLNKAYPMVLLELFADGSGAPASKPAASSALDFGELTLVDDDEVQAQVELSRAQQMALHTTDAILSELNGLVSAAQGLPRVQPERNPLRPENYIRALQRAIADTQVIAPMREAWMQHMRPYLSQQLVGVYERAVKGLREHGVEQVGWGARVPQQPAYPQGALGSGWYGPGAGEGRSGWATASAWAGSQAAPVGYQEAGASGYAPSGQEALLTVSILRQMLAGAGDPYQELYAPTGSAGSVYAGGQQAPSPQGFDRYAPAGASEAIEDIAQLERLVGRLANSQSAYLHSGQGAPRTGQASLYGAAEAAPRGAEVVARMVENISQDARLLPPVQQAVQNLEPAIRKLIRHDSRFFSDANHPARRLLDEITQRSLAYTHVEAPGFSRFMRLIDQAVAHLSKSEITSAAPFETVRRALQAAWEAQQKKLEARQEREKQALLLAEEREMRAERVAAEIGALPEFPGAPQDITDFVLGPWVEVVAAAPLDAQGKRSPQAASALALVPLLLWSVQPDLACEHPDRLDEATMLLPVRLRTELENIGHPREEIDAFLARLAQLHRLSLAARPPDFELPQASVPEDGGPGDLEQDAANDGDSVTSLYGPEPMAEPEVQQEDAPAPRPPESDGFVMGAWVELVTSGKLMRTQLTWCSPHNTLFLFTAPDGSTQSMTRRMRDKLVAGGALRLMDALPATEQALRSAAKPQGNEPPPLV
ncbi:MAG: DUF1631 family protein [Burkholderiales bacterium]|nr:DUF1631 family protein [Burkholderiales bacterium]